MHVHSKKAVCQSYFPEGRKAISAKPPISERQFLINDGRNVNPYYFLL